VKCEGESGSSVLRCLPSQPLCLPGAATKSSAHGRPAGQPDTYVTDWDAVFSQAFSAAALTPPDGFVISAYMGSAVYDSVMAIDGGYRPFAVDVDAPRGASAQAAVAAAAHRILVHYLPAQAATIIDPAYDASLATIPEGKAKRDGVATGEAVAAFVIAQRADDGFRAPVTYTPPNPPSPASGSRLRRPRRSPRTPRSCDRSASSPPTSSGLTAHRLSAA
jgi:hypothetical protein